MSGECVYCGRKEPKDRDHIPPKNLFPPPRPSNLITVPSCRRCNREASLDDEYFRLMLTMRDSAYEHPAAKEAWRSAMSRLARTESRGFRNSVLSSVREVELRTLMGIYLGAKRAYDVDFGRLETVADRVCRGLFFHHFGRRLPPSCSSKAMVLDRFTSGELSSPGSLANIVAPLLGRPSTAIGERVFTYQWLPTADSDAHPNSTAWLFTFYDSTRFLALTVDAVPPGYRRSDARLH